MMKQGFKILTILLIGLLLISIIPINTSEALTNPLYAPGAYKPSVNNEADSGIFIDIGQMVIGILQGLGILISVVSLMVIGFKYISGSLSQKAEYKERLVPYLIGAVMVFAIPQIVGLVYELITSNFH